MAADSPSSPSRPLLTRAQLTALARRGVRQVTTPGDVLYRSGERDYDFIVIEAGRIDVVRPDMPDAPESVLGTWGPRRFLGELSLLTGQTAVATARVRTSGVVHRLAPERFRELMEEDVELAAVPARNAPGKRCSESSGRPSATSPG